MVSIELPFPRIKTSKNEILLSFSSFKVNLIFSWKEFNTDSTQSMELGFMCVIVSSTYLFHLVISIDNFGITFLSKSTVKIPAITGPNGDPIVTPSFHKNIKFTLKEEKDNKISF